MSLFGLAFQSAWNRRFSLGLTVLSLAISIMLLVGVDMVRKEARANFINTISNTDLIVGARSGPINLLLYSVFRLGDATNNVSWESYEKLSRLDQVAWSVPLSLGDSHRGFRVLGTNPDYFRYYQYAGDGKLVFAQGKSFETVFDVVLGADVASQLGYQLGQKIILSHGLVSSGFADHDDKPFTIVGILARTGTPVDRTVHIPLEGVSAIHVDWQSGRRSAIRIDAAQALKMDLQPREITAFMLGLKNRVTTFRVQRQINEFREEPLLAIIPGSTLTSLWRTIGNFEVVLLGISALVVVAGLSGMLTTIMSSLNERRREMAVLRAIGAHPYHILLLFALETLLLMLMAILLGLILLYGAAYAFKPLLLQWLGINLGIGWLDWQQLGVIGAITLTALVISLIPGLIAYRRSLQDGLMIRI
jgi:putative ABC transport system permease protein